MTVITKCLTFSPLSAIIYSSYLTVKGKPAEKR
jgi:hypothetical protein